jgi:hypothetical protein
MNRLRKNIGKPFIIASKKKKPKNLGIILTKDVNASTRKTTNTDERNQRRLQKVKKISHAHGLAEST